MEPSQRVYTRAQAAAQVGVHEDTLEKYERQRKIRRVRRDELGARVYTEDDLEVLRAYFRR